MSRILSLRDVKRTYGEPPVAACAGVSLEIDYGEFVAIVGPSGSGKSTLLHCMAGLDEPTSGLDPLMERVFTEEVARAAAEGRTVLLSSHILAEVQRLCSAVTIVGGGRVVVSPGGRLPRRRPRAGR